MAVSKAFKKAVGCMLKCLMIPMPIKMIAALCRMRPDLHAYVPKGKEILLQNYLGIFKVFVNTDFPIEREALSGKYEADIHRVLPKLVKCGDSCVDVGANVGLFSLQLLKIIGQEGKIYAFEPGVPTFQRLRKNLSINGNLTLNVEASNCGLSNREGMLFWNEHMNALGNANLSEECLPGGIEVPVTTLDIFVQKNKIDKVDFIKIDVESMEYEVIMGAIATIGQHRPAILYETLPEFIGFRSEPVYEYIHREMEKLDYVVYRISHTGQLQRTTYPNYSLNTVALPSEIRV